MNALALTVSLVCFYGDGSSLTDSCVSVFEADTVVECATLGDTSVPLHINTGTHNPGPGFVSFYATRYEGGPVSGVELLFSTPYESRGSISHGSWFEAVYVVPPDDVGFRDDLEGCSCFSRSADPDRSCLEATHQ